MKLATPSSIHGDQARIIIQLKRPPQSDYRLNLILQPLSAVILGLPQSNNEATLGMDRTSSSWTRDTRVIPLDAQYRTADGFAVELGLRATGRFGCALRAQLVGYSPSTRAKFSGYADIAFAVSGTPTQKVLQGPVPSFEILKRQADLLTASAVTGPPVEAFQREILAVDYLQNPPERPANSAVNRRTTLTFDDGEVRVTLPPRGVQQVRR